MNIATRNNRYLMNASAANRTVNSGEPIMVCAIICANIDDAAEDTVQILDASSNNLMDIEVGPNGFETVEAPWLADAGLIVSSTGGGAGTIVTVLWRPSG
jgi:hypothetical protein